jgi:Protein of unknown function (DUF3606)
MADDKTKLASDRKFINLNEDYEVRDWTQSLGCTEQELRDAVKAVGNSVEAVRYFLDR